MRGVVLDLQVFLALELRGKGGGQHVGEEVEKDRQGQLHEGHWRNVTGLVF